MKDNPNRRKAIIWAIVTALAIFAIIMLNIFGKDRFPGWYIVIPTVSWIIPIASITVIIYYISQARLLDRTLKGANFLAHWTYSREEWDRYTEAEYRTRDKENRSWYYTFSAAALICGILFFVFKQSWDRPIYILFFSVFIIVPVVVWFSAWGTYRQNKRYLGEAYITPDAVYLNRRLMTWRGTGRELESVIVAENESQHILVITYSDPARSGGKNESSIRVPVPRGQEKAAAEIAEKLNSKIAKKLNSSE